jgi:hypothetical protein
MSDLPPHADCPCVCHLDALVACDSPTCAAINFYRAEDVAAFQAACDHQMHSKWGCTRCGKGRPDPMWQEVLLA